MGVVAHSHPAGYRLLLAMPPYRATETIVDIDRSPVSAGGVILLEPNTDRAAAPHEAVSLVRRLRFEASVAVGLRLPIHRLADVASLLLNASAVGTRALVLPDAPLHEQLYTHLSRPFDLAGDWLDWVDARHRLSGDARRVCAAIIRHAADFDSVTTLLHEHGFVPRTVRHLLARGSLPKADAWHHGTRLIEIQLEMQRARSANVDRFAIRHGYGEGSSLSDAVRTCFGVGCRTATQMLGLEWRFQAWWRRYIRGSRS